MRTRTALSALAIWVGALLVVTGCASPSHEQPTLQQPGRPEAVAPTPAAMTVDGPARVFDRTQHSTTDPASVWVVVNKKHPLPSDYRPAISLVRGYQVATPAAGELTRLLDASDDADLGFKIASAFRSYGYQAGVYAHVVTSSGQEAADQVSARPGHSEHQTGLAADLVTPASPACDFEACFARTPGGRWLAQHAWEYGFIVRYQPGSTAVTGYSPEPWHLRFVGRALAAELRRTHVATLEEFFHISGGDYP